MEIAHHLRAQMDAPKCPLFRGFAVHIFTEKTTSVSRGFVCPTLCVKTGKRGQAPQLPVPRCAPTFQTPFFHAPFPGS